jgi:ribosome-associated protein
MGRKTKGFQWVREDQDEQAIERVERPIRQMEKDSEHDLELLARRLVELTPSARRVLPLPEETIAALDALAKLSRTPARGRQARFVKLLLRQVDLEALNLALAGDTEHASMLRGLERWRTRLVDGDDDDLQAYIEEYPSSDRVRIRALVRAARGEDDAASRASRRLFKLLKAASGVNPLPEEGGVVPDEGDGLEASDADAGAADAGSR